jgi:predicted nucleic acid-binding protein
MAYLVDANVLSEPTKPEPSGKVVEWLTVHERELVVDSIILGELLIEILSLPSGRKRVRLERWFESVVQAMDCIPWDVAVSRRWAGLVVQLQRRRQTMPMLDGMIAATALEHGLTLATRNVRDFQKAGVRVLDPFG